MAGKIDLGSTRRNLLGRDIWILPWESRFGSCRFGLAG